MAALASSYGLGNALYFPLGAGAGAWLEPGARTPAAAERACRTGGVTALFGVPTGWARLARHAAEGRVQRSAFARVRLAVSAGEPLSAQVWHAVERELGLRLVNGLGCSEASNLYLSERPGTGRPGSVGVPVPGFDLRVTPDGELLVRGASVMAGYRDDPAASARALRDGWLHTGDLVRREPDGRYAFLGRRGDRFKAGGSWVDPRGVAAVLREEPGVVDAGVVGASDRQGVVRVAAVLAAPSASAGLAERAGRRCAAELAPHERPRTILVVDELPVTGSGKLDRGALRRLVDAATGAGAAT
jgi:benzoate-CoA ligase